MADFEGFFLTNRFSASNITLHPRVPHSAADDEDKKTERICVAPTLLGCLKAIMLRPQIYSIYQCYVPDPHWSKPTAAQVPDALLTDEHWVTTSTEFQRVGLIDLREDAELCYGERGYGKPPGDSNLEKAVFASQMANFEALRIAIPRLQMQGKLQFFDPG
jgi:hypothetical protein